MRRRDTFASLRAHNYRLYFVAAVFTTTGSWMQRVATDWLVLELTGSVALVGLSVSVQFAPTLLLGLWAGVISDRLPRRRVLIVTQTIIMTTNATLAALVLSGTVETWQVFTAAGVVGTAMAVDGPVRAAFISELVGKERLGNAISLNSSIFHFGGLLGPALSGLLIAGIGSGPSIAVNAVASLVSVTTLASMRRAELVRAPRVPRARGQIREAIRFVVGQPLVLWPIMLLAAISLFGMNLPVLLTASASETYGTGAAGYGFYSSFAALGAFLGAALSARRGVVRLRGLVLLALGFGVITMCAGWAPWYWSFLAALVGLGAARVLFATGAQALTQLSSEDQLRGRVISLYLMVLLGGQAIGGVLMGWVAGHWGARWAFVVAGAGPLLVALVIGVMLVRARRSTRAEGEDPLTP